MPYAPVPTLTADPLVYAAPVLANPVLVVVKLTGAPTVVAPVVYPPVPVVYPAPPLVYPVVPVVYPVVPVVPM